MKKVICGEELREKILEAVELIGNTLSTTIGPTGNNVLVNNSDLSPFITNDGVTIASNIESDDEVINTLLEIIKEASLKTNELVGDGTTTTIVLLQSIMKYGIDAIEKGVKPLVLKRELEKSLDEVLKLLDDKKRLTKKKDYINIASISANSKEIGKTLSDIFCKTYQREVIHLEESSTSKTYLVEKKGYMVDINALSNLYFHKKKEIVLDACYVLILKGCLDNLEKVSECINECVRLHKPLVIIGEEFLENLYHDVLSFYLNEEIPIFLVTLEEYSSHLDKVESDIAESSHTNIKNIEYEKVHFSDLGMVDNIILSREKMILSVSDINEEYLSFLKSEYSLEKDKYEKEFIAERLAKLEYGITSIYVGGATKTEVKEKLMRYEDALSSLDVARFGVLPGEGISLLEISDTLSGNTTGNQILKKSLCMPFYKIIENTGEDSDVILNYIRESQYQKIYRIDNNSYEDITNTDILDPYKVVVVSLENAVSIASILLTITHLVVNTKIGTDKELL